MKNLRNRINVKLVNNEKDYLKCASKPTYMSRKIVHNNLVAIRKSKLALKLNKPARTEMCSLGLSKVLMHEFHYDYIKSKYDSNSGLLFTDTVSFIYEMKTEYVYEDFSSDKEISDFSNYSTKSKYYNNSSKLVTGKIKDDLKIKGFVD